ncbi:bifunctional 2-polyprenyl-6-hydroxyphenol methylase/3-demethylubiquinol 3-O-methyltransferase UbiG [Ponticaulis sp.]|uniref:class I SAM-dependent methyltransferase n=1 Tax=Ponticaulis sp. TaxID=2020902 RepID=UPI000C4C0ABF|nr:class I SAM-dependent methyltransferase [Ponticaulis sp.]MBN05460.1 SAM-dependent methyltransferase [Ponticaulis sp.]
MTQDVANGYDEIADAYLSARSDIGADVISDWASDLPKGAAVVDIGAGTGWPVTQVLIDAGVRISAIEASPKLAGVFRERFPDVELACEAAETSDFFGCQFDGAVAIGLMFLLSEAGQMALIERVSGALKSGGRFLFSAPHQVCEWEDALTGRMSRSLGLEVYRKRLADCGMTITGSYKDTGGNFYLNSRKL